MLEIEPEPFACQISKLQFGITVFSVLEVTEGMGESWLVAKVVLLVGLSLSLLF